MKTRFKPYHHYKGDDLSPSEKVERKVIELLLSSNISDKERDSSIIFEIKHSSECIQVARILAQKRNLNIELAEAAAALHDINVIVKGRYKDHARLGAPVAEKILKEIGGFSASDMKIICDAVAHHSEKNIYSKNPYIELIKDADSFECSLYKNAKDEYKLTKSPFLFKEYINRIKKVRHELGLPKEPVFRK